MESIKEPGSDTKNREIITQRLINAPRELVFEVFTNPKHVINWWGPDGFTNTIYEMNVVRGGIWRFMMHGPDGRNYPNKVVFLKIDKPSRIEFRHMHDDGSEKVSHYTIMTFEEQGSKTLFTLTGIFESAEERERVTREYGAVEGGRQTVAKLARYAETFGADKGMTLIREYNAPRELVFKAWTDAQALAQWWGPREAKIEVKEFDLRPGGIFLYSMEVQPGKKIWGKFVYREIVAPERIVFINSFSDENGGYGPNPWLPVWPQEIWNLLTLTEHDGKTTLTLSGYPINATEEEYAAYEGLKGNMQEGFKGTFDALEEYLEKNT